MYYIEGDKVYVDGIYHPELALRGTTSVFSGLYDYFRTNSWKTSALGIISAIAGFIVSNPGDVAQWPWMSHVAGFVLAGGLAAFGLVARDNDKHTPPETPQQPALIPGIITAPIVSVPGYSTPMSIITPHVDQK